MLAQMCVSTDTRWGEAVSDRQYLHRGVRRGSTLLLNSCYESSAKNNSAWGGGNQVNEGKQESESRRMS